MTINIDIKPENKELVKNAILRWLGELKEGETYEEKIIQYIKRCIKENIRNVLIEQAKEQIQEIEEL